MTIDIEPKCDDFYMDNVLYRVPRPPLRYHARKWWRKRRMRHAMKVLKRLFKGITAHIEDARTLELIECEGGEYVLRIRLVD